MPWSTGVSCLQLPTPWLLGAITSFYAKMPRHYKCKKCGVEHPPPTGKHCQHQAGIDEGATEQQNDGQMLRIMLDIQKRMDDIETEMRLSKNPTNIQAEGATAAATSEQQTSTLPAESSGGGNPYISTGKLGTNGPSGKQNRSVRGRPGLRGRRNTNSQKIAR